MTITESNLSLENLQQTLKAMRKERGPISVEDYRKLRFLARSFNKACPHAQIWAEEKVNIYNATRH
ncbi:MAG: hypothetical protein DI585_00145 [Pseudomonas fluorescens]|nr:MAG: hypothetical protein DI585_00145 [Pseudomonas fluorescens]